LCHSPNFLFPVVIGVKIKFNPNLFALRCGRWFGRGIDDGALERLLVAEAIVSRPVDETQSDCEQPSPMDQRRPESPSSVAAIFLSPRKTNKFDVANSTYSSGAHQNQQRMMRRLRSPSSDRRKMSSDYELPMAGGQSMEGIAGGVQTLGLMTISPNAIWPNDHLA
jgi:hypothetical protein